jgi:hypothetical protein
MCVLCVLVYVRMYKYMCMCNQEGSGCSSNNSYIYTYFNTPHSVNSNSVVSLERPHMSYMYVRTLGIDANKNAKKKNTQNTYMNSRSNQLQHVFILGHVHHAQTTKRVN